MFIARAHQLVMEGYQWTHNQVRTAIRVYSCQNKKVGVASRELEVGGALTISRAAVSGELFLHSVNICLPLFLFDTMLIFCLFSIST